MPNRLAIFVRENTPPAATPNEVAAVNTQDAVGPAIDDATTTLAAEVFGRWVFGSFNINPTAVNAARIDCKVETAVPGVYAIVQECGVGALALVVQQETFGFFVPTGRRYKFARLALAGTTETFNRYSFSEA